MQSVLRGLGLVCVGVFAAACGEGRGPIKTPPRADYDGGDSGGGDALPSVCGNGRVEGLEVCDGANLNQQTCASRGFASGSLRCAANCLSFDTSNCVACGNNAKDPGEICDGADLGGKSCVALGFTGGTLACNRTCDAFVTDGCLSRAECGNDLVEAPEPCDGTDLNQQTCRTLGYDSGTLACNADCTAFNEAACVTSEVCGNNTAAGPELCDGTDLKGKACTDVGYSGGTLACAANCRSYVETGCTGGACGNNQKETGEACDGTDLANQTCVSQGYTGGTLACRADCQGFNFAACTGAPTCGDNVAAGLEACDGTALRGRTCQSLGFDGGTLTCKADCTGFVTTACTGTQRPQCGDGVARGLEVCDGQSWQLGPACADFGMGTGNATCTFECKADFTGCENQDLCAANDWYEDGWCDACQLLGGTLDPDCAALCPRADGECSSYYDAIAGVYTCEAAGFTDPDCGTCGDGLVEEPEVCDGADLGGATCADWGFEAGTLGCSATCTPVFTGCVAPVCGNATREGSEVCDGADLAQQTCMTQGFVSGTLSCKADCTGFDTRECVSGTCGNNAVEAGELCDGGNLNGYSCAKLGFGGGALTCGARCNQFVTTACTPKPASPTCGDGSVNGLSICDGTTWGFDLTGDCAELGLGSGTMTCSAFCRPAISTCSTPDLCAALDWYGDGYCDACHLLGGTVDTDCAAACPAADGECADYFDSLAGAWTCRTLGYVDPDCGACGNGTLDGGEFCDGSTQALTCADFGYLGGTLACAPDCTPTFASCSSAQCGNNLIEPPETCEGTNFDGKTCASLGFAGGTLSCASCQIVTTGCTNVACGNNLREGDEACDGTDLADLTCVRLGFTGGTLACNSGCTAFDLSGCTATPGLCGNDALDGLESCDGAAWGFGGPACADFGMGTGNATCQANCTPDFSSCQNPDLCAANSYYDDGWCDACHLLGGDVDTECAALCGADGYCADYFDLYAGVWTCQSLGFNDPDCGTCGNSQIDGNEWCDGSNLDGFTCVDYGFAGGTLACKSDCTPNFAGCTAAQCNNNTIEGDELCDGTAVGGLSCAGFGYASGTLRCNETCSGYSTTSCTGTAATTCGDGQLNGLELCDGALFEFGPACTDFGFESGTVSCDGCRPRYGACQTTQDLCAALEWYNDGLCDACDLLGGSFDPDCALCTVADETCVDYFDTLVYAWSCRHLGLVDPDCGSCGNNTIDGYEYCDGTALGTLSCAAFGFSGGTIGCKADCTPSFTGCTNAVCGNNQVEGNEVCDGTDLGGQTCQAQGFAGGGTLSCNAGCQSFNTNLCTSTAWTCSPAYYGTDDGCDCGCGAVDPDCDDATAASCLFCNNAGSCDEEGTDCSLIDPVNNAICNTASEWTCDPDYYGTDDGCDCGCGMLDPDCANATVDACDYCDDEGSCGTTDCSTIDPANNAVCEEAVWTCDPDYYDDGFLCDCGCGIVDPDCADALVGSCDFCDMTGSCGIGDCPANINPTNNAVCQ